jgi:WD40 repeat protein/predicted SprT family Zn-dependent metalloprotease
MKSQTIFAALLLTLLSGISVLPIQAQQDNCLPPVALPAATEPNIFTPEQEVFLGEAVAESIQKNYRIIEDVELTKYLTGIGEQLNRHLPLSNMRFQFFLVDLPNANAFVLPGGRIYVSRKLVALAESADELAGVIAHELGHLVAHESAIDITRRFKEVLGVTLVIDRRDVFEKYNQLIDNIRRKPEAFRPRDRERGQMVADQVGFYSLVKAGYDPAALARFWDRMTETKGKTGSWFSDVFGSTKPEERRLREMLKAVSLLPTACVGAKTTPQNEEFKKWQSAVVSYTGMGRRESLHGVLSKQVLSPPLLSDISHIRFSPDGKYILAQDDSGINVLTREPFTPIFRIEAPDANPASFTPDSQSIVFYTDNLRVESWSVAEKKMSEAKEVVIRRGCLQTALSPDGKFLACASPSYDLKLLEVASGKIVFQKEAFFEPSILQFLLLLERLSNRRSENDDAGLNWINMKFSPDGRYFVAGHGGRDFRQVIIAEAFDMTTLTKVSLPDSIRKFIAGGFTFAGNDRLIGVNSGDFKKSAEVEFPSGKMVSEFPLRGNIEAPTRGNYLLIRPVKDYPLGVMDMSNKVIFKSNKRPALDIFDNVFVAEMRNGEIGLYRMEKSELIATAILPDQTLGRLRVAEISPDMKWLALSGRLRGGVWNLTKGEAALYLRGFNGGFISPDGYFYADFPKYETAERNIAKFNLANGEVVPGAKLESSYARQAGQYLITTKSAKPNVKEGAPVDYSKNIIIEMFDARNMTSLWSKTYTKESPRTWVAPNQGTVALLWNVTDEAAKIEIKADARLGQQLAAMKEKEGDYFLQILDVKNGNPLGKLLIETGKGSFRLSNVFAAGDWVIIADTQNRVQVYSLKTGELKGRVFGGFATVSSIANLLCVENEKGQLTIYNLETMEKRDQFNFSSPVSLIRFNEDGRRLLVLTSNQTAYILDVSSTATSSSAVKN